MIMNLSTTATAIVLAITRVPGTTHFMQAEIRVKSGPARIQSALQEEVEQELLRMASLSRVLARSPNSSTPTR